MLEAALIRIAHAADKQLQIEKKRTWMNKNYPAGTCNAEDAWSDFSKEIESNGKELRQALREWKRLNSRGIASATQSHKKETP